MALKILHWLGIVACILLLISCVIPWAYYADIQENFTGFYSFKNQYGKPGKLLTIIAVISLALIFLPKIWAKRSNLFVCALGVGYAIKSYILYTSCYNAYCPEKKIGIFLMMAAVLVMMLAAIFPDLKLKDKQKN